MSLRFMNGAFKLKGVQTVKYEVDVPVLVKAPEVPAVAPEVPAVVEVPTVAPSEVEAPLEVPQAAPESGLIPENPPTE
jgi:hypothetical protein